MRSLKETITKRLDSYNESVLSSNNASLVIELKKLLCSEPNKNNLHEINRLWEKVFGWSKSYGTWTKSYGPSYSYERFDGEEVMCSWSVSSEHRFYFKELDEKQKDIIIKTLSLEKKKGNVRDYIFI